MILKLIEQTKNYLTETCDIVSCYKCHKRKTCEKCFKRIFPWESWAMTWKCLD